MNNETQKYCEKAFATHKATLIQDTDRYLIIDWRREDGSGDCYVNYIVDKKRGSLIVSGDLGDSIATWYNPVMPANFVSYIRDIDYYISKMQCASNKYIFDKNNIFDDIKKYLDIDIDDLDFYLCNEYSDEEEFWEDIASEVEDSEYSDTYFMPTGDLINKIEMFDSNYVEWLYYCGRRTHPRVYLWATGFIMACEQLGI